MIMLKRMLFTGIILLSFLTLAWGQHRKDSAKYVEPEKGFYEKEIRPALKKEKNEASPKTFKVWLKSDNLPDNKNVYQEYWHNQPESQGATGTCWAYAATSFLESEIHRLKDKKVRLSEMYFVYMDYVERTRAYVEKRGDVYFNHGSEANAVTRMMEKYGAVPYQEYPGKTPRQEFHDHGEMMKEMKAYLQSVKNQNAWNEKVVVSTIKSIMNHYMGEPPVDFTVEGQKYHPTSYVEDYLDFDPNHYFSFMSTKSKDFWAARELVEPDNWWHADNYYNLPLENYFNLIDRAIRKGFTICICGDVSEPGHLSNEEVSIIPDFDIPAEYINQDAREMRLNNKSTTDDHCIHLVGHTEKDGEKWYLIKDSGAGGFDGPHKGYRFFHEDYIKLKMMNILVHRDAARVELDRIIK